MLISRRTGNDRHSWHKTRQSELSLSGVIASYLDNALKMPIFVAGFGESGLLVATADEVAEPKNRRAIYVDEWDDTELDPTIVVRAKY